MDSAKVEIVTTFLAKVREHLSAQAFLGTSLEIRPLQKPPPRSVRQTLEGPQDFWNFAWSKTDEKTKQNAWHAVGKFETTPHVLPRLLEPLYRWFSLPTPGSFDPWVAAGCTHVSSESVHAVRTYHKAVAEYGNTLRDDGTPQPYDPESGYSSLSFISSSSDATTFEPLLTALSKQEGWVIVWYLKDDRVFPFDKFVVKRFRP